jgi:trk system potassium uptake protein TrkA
MRKFAIIGLGRFGMQLARALSEAGSEVVAIDRDPKLVEQISDDVTVAVCLDSTDEEALRAQEIDRIDTVIVGIGSDFESAALTVAILRRMNVRRVIARAERDIQRRILLSIGAHEVVSPERESALRWSQRLSLPNIREHVELGEDYSIVYVSAPRTFHNRTLEDLHLRNKYGVNVVAIHRQEHPTEQEGRSEGRTSVISLPRADTVILPDDVLIVVGANDELSRLPQD